MIIAAEAATQLADVGLFKLAWIIVVVPFISWLLTLFFGKRSPMDGAIYGIIAVGFDLLLSVVIFVQNALGTPPYNQRINAMQLGRFEIEFGLHIDGLASMMLLVVTLISFLVHVYSLGYMKGEPRYTFYFATLSLFTGSMLILVTADNLLQLLVGWELVGLCSYLLIGHYWEKKENSNAAIKAFITTRVGDVGMIFGIVVLFSALGSFDIAKLNEAASSGAIARGALTVGAALLFCGAVGKSAQFPLHVWLPDAMAGPTPVSALIHAATMVVAGVYLVARTFGVFERAFHIGEAGPLNIVAIIGTITMLMAALLALVQDDIKRVLAYSTVSQLGYMIAALGVGAWTGAVFHLFTHAMFKALLFLGAGSVIHAVHSNNMSDMGGLRKYMPQTFYTFLIGSAALAGVPGLAGFFSKDEILHGALKNQYYLVFGVGLLTAGLTALYMTRCVYLTFFSEYRGHGHPHESPRVMTLPLITLAVLSISVGYLNFWGVKGFGTWITFEGHGEVAAFDPVALSMSVAAAAGGILIGLLIYHWKLGPRGAVERSTILRGLHRFLLNRYYIDELYIKVIVRPIQYSLSRAAYWINQNVIDAVVNSAGILTARGLARLAYWFDQNVVDSVVNAAAEETAETGGVLRHIQTGKVQQYAAVVIVASALLGIMLVVFLR
ncbi:MAG: NADH-quinone oxidoreductase subunit L [Acidimicrobiia bacterium]